MKYYQVELKRTSYISICVDAESEEEAEEKAWREIENGRTDIYDAQWEIEFTQECNA
jgi:hypothetical protein